jgi:serine/threonine-protein kinase
MDVGTAVTAPVEVQPVDLSESAGTPPPGKKVDPYVGRTIDGRYVVESVLGEGGMGVVYRGRHKVIDKRVAIKVLRGEMASDSEITERFLQEARAASAIGNPHIIDISDFGQLPDGSTYFVMEFLDGKSLGDLMNEKKPIPVPRLCHIAKQIANGLAAAHAAKIVHRDLKPDNIMLVSRGSEKDFVKILDFGIAKVGTAKSKMTKAGSVFGTPHYMSPEQAAGAVVDSRTDIYALGVILYEMAAGKVPFDADNFMGILTQHMYKAPVPIRALVPEVDVPPGLDAIILKSLTKKPEGRYETMEQVVADLEKLEKGLMPDAVQEMMARSGGFNVPADYFRSSAMPAPVPATPAGVPRKRWPLYAAIFAVCSVVGIVAVIFAKSTSSTARENNAPSTTAPPATSVTVATTTTASAASSADTVVKHKILVGVSPIDATIVREGKNLGKQPVELMLADDEVATLVISKDKFEQQTVQVKASDGSPQNFMLTATKPTGGGVGAKTAPPATTSLPWSQPPQTTTSIPAAPTSTLGNPFAHH